MKQHTYTPGTVTKQQLDEDHECGSLMLDYFVDSVD